jgi:hypothetical protein
MATRIRPLEVDVTTKSGPIKGYHFYAKGIDEKQGILDVEVTYEGDGQKISHIDRQHVSVNVPKKRKQYAFALCGKTEIDAEKIEAALQELFRAVETFLREHVMPVGGPAGPESSADLSREEALQQASKTLFGGAVEIVEVVRRCSDPVWYRLVTTGGTAYFNEGELVHQGTFFKIIYN